MNILKRYVLGEVLRAFLLALLTMTAFSCSSWWRPRP